MIARAFPVMVRGLLAGGQVLRQYFGAGLTTRTKENHSSVVTAADVKAERIVLKLLRQAFPSHNFLAEESGRRWRGSEYTWIIDPLDGTSNFAADIPWFGTMMALMQQGEVILAGMYLPVQDVLYTGEKGGGTRRNGVPLALASSRRLGDQLWAYSMDVNRGPRTSHRQVAQLWNLGRAVRNVRTTNSLVDMCYTLDGKLGGFVNQHTRVWDIAPISLLLPEAGGAFTDLRGRFVPLDLTAAGYHRNYAVMGTHPRQLSAVVNRLNPPAPRSATFTSLPPRQGRRRR